MLLGNLGCRGKDFRVIKRVGGYRNSCNTKQKAKVTYTVYQKCFQVGKDRGGFFIPETNQ